MNSPDLHAAILNLPPNAKENIEADISGVDWSRAVEYSFKHGHKVARHAAAELVLPLVERCRGLEKAIVIVKMAKDLVDDKRGWGTCQRMDSSDLCADAHKLFTACCSFLAKIEKGGE